MNDVRHEGGENVMNFEEAFQVGHVHQEMHALQGVHDVCLVVVEVVAEVAIRYLYLGDKLIHQRS